MSIAKAILSCWVVALIPPWAFGEVGILIGHVSDDDTGQSVPARVYISDTQGKFYLPTRSPKDTIAIYDNVDKIAGTGIQEIYAVVGAHAFRAELPPGRYTVTVERGKEYLPLSQTVVIQANETTEQRFRIKRLFNMAEQGWYSADCHVHTKLTDLPAAQLADDLNVAFPVTAWALRSDQIPEVLADKMSNTSVPDRGRVVQTDDTHVFWNLNTEYEISRIGDRRCRLLGSMLVLGQRTPLALTAPPIKPVIDEAHAQGAITDSVAPCMAWSNMIVPVGKVDTTELNHHAFWRQRTLTGYLWDRQPMSWVGTPPLTASQYADHLCENYYALLNCGFRLRLSGGSANGVHALPLGTDRIYAKVDGPFTYEKWFESFRRGRSFSTNGPILLLTADGLEPGAQKNIPPDKKTVVHVSAQAHTVATIDRIELVVNGTIMHTARPTSAAGQPAVHHFVFERDVEIHGAGWIAARCFEAGPKDNIRFAHTGPIWFNDPSKPLLPAPRQIQYLTNDLAGEIERRKSILPDPALAEYRQALNVYQQISGLLATTTEEEKAR